MPPLKFQIILHFYDSVTDEPDVSKEPVRCPGCGNTAFIRPNIQHSSYDLMCSRCEHNYSIADLTYRFNF